MYRGRRMDAAEAAEAFALLIADAIAQLEADPSNAFESCHLVKLMDNFKAHYEKRLINEPSRENFAELRRTFDGRLEDARELHRG